MKTMIWFQITVTILMGIATFAAKHRANPPYPDWWYGTAAASMVVIVIVFVGPYVAYLGAKHGREARRRRMNANR